MAHRILTSLVGIDATFSSTLSLTSLAGVGNRMLIVNSAGTVSTQAIPTGTVTSVGLSMPSAFTVTNSPVTGAGTLTVTGAGSTLQYIDGTGALQTFPTTLPSTKVQHQVKAGVAINKGQAVYVTSADGTNMIVGLASNDTEATSSKTMGLLDATVSTNGFANVVTEGLLAGLDTTAATSAGDPVWLGTNGNLLYGMANKPSAPSHMVFIGIVTRINLNNGEIFVKVQNGFELQELHNVQITSTPADNTVLSYENSSSLYKMKSIATLLGYTPVSGTGTTNYLSKFTGSTALGNSLVYDDGTNVGIGTATPSYKLDVNGVINAGSNFIGNIPSSQYIYAAGGGTGEFRFVNGAGGGWYYTWYQNSGTAVPSGEKMRLSTSNNLLIGTSTDAGYKLDVLGTARIQNTLTVSNPSYSGGGSFFQSANFTTVISGGPAGENVTFGPSNRIFLNASQVRVQTGSLQIASTLSVGTTNATALNMIWANGSITAGSNIARGIFTDTTLVASANNDVLVGLDVAPTFTNGAFTGVQNYAARISGALAGVTKYMSTGTGATSHYLEIISTSSTNTYVNLVRNGNANGTYGYYLNNGVASLSVDNGSGETKLYANNGGYYLTFFSNGVEAMRIPTTRNVLIGTTTDGGYKLSVNGSGNFNLGNSGYVRLQSGSGQRHGYIQSAYSNFLFSNNIYYDGSNWRYDQNGYGAQIQTETLSSGVIAFNTFASGTAGNVATIIESMRIVNNGNILMGTTTDSGYKLDVNGTSRFTNSISLTGSNRYIGSGSSSQSVYITGGTNYTDGAYFNLTGNTYGFSPGGGSAEFVIRTNSDSKFALFGYNGSSWSRYMTLFGPTGNLNIGYATSDLGYKLSIQGDTYNTGQIVSVGNISSYASVLVNGNSEGYDLMVYPDTTSGPNNLYSGGQVKANIYTSSVGTTTIVPSTTQVLMSWYPSTTQAVFIDYVIWIDGPDAMRSGTFTIVNDAAGNVQYNDVSTIDLNASTSSVVLNAANNGGTMEFTAYNSGGNIVYMNIITRYIPTMF